MLQWLWILDLIFIKDEQLNEREQFNGKNDYPQYELWKNIYIPISVIKRWYMED